MPRRYRLAWKLSAVVLAVVAVVIVGASLLSGHLSRRYALAVTRGVMDFNSASIGSGIDELMMSGNKAGARAFIADMIDRSATYHDLNLVSHPAGLVTASGHLTPGTKLAISDRSCTPCHLPSLSDASGASDASHASHAAPKPVAPVNHDEIFNAADGTRLLQVVTPVLNRPDCRTAACHAQADSGAVLGILTAQYSLAAFDVQMRKLNLLLALAVVLAILLAVGALLVMFRTLLDRPLRLLVAGTNILAAGNMSFRFRSKGDDEIAQVEESFDEMADQIQAHQRELQKARDYLEGIVENTADLVITVNTKGLIQTFNRGAEAALGYQRMEVLGKRVETLFADPQERDVAIARLAEQDNVVNWRTRFTTRSGEIRHVLLTLSRLRNRRGEMIGTLGISKDVTTEQELQEELIRSEKEAAIGRAVTHIQHSIKNMLNTLRGGLYVMQVGIKKSQRDYIDEGGVMIEEGLARISDLSLSMLKYAREWKIEPEAVDLGALVAKIKVAIGITAKESGVKLCIEVEDAMPVVHCDPRLIHMVLMDIASNALDACAMKDYDAPEEPALFIRVGQNAGAEQAVVEVQDNGVGMTAEVVEHVFTPFFSTKKKTGTGLGLALTARIIDLHGGEIAVESEPDEGATFRVTLPLAGQGE